MLRKISSPSRPASQALMSVSTSFRLMSFARVLSRPCDFSIGFSAKRGGMCGNLSNDHLPRWISCSSGTASSNRWPTAEETTYWSLS